VVPSYAYIITCTEQPEPEGVPRWRQSRRDRQIPIAW
jgi:hypothetical protein